MSRRVTYAEIDLKRCANTYGSAPCTAAVGVTGEIKCFNGLGTCQDRANYVEEIETVRFNIASTLTAVEEISIPNILTVDYTPAVLKLGESIGVRSSVKIVFSDHAFPDTGPAGDRYLSDRNYNPYEQGSFWGKFRARFPFLRGHKLRLIQGTTDQSVSQMETRHFIIDSMAGLTSTGTFTIIAKDILKLTDDKRAQAPRLSNGYLSANIAAAATSVTLNPVGIGDIEYPASGVANIGGKEIVSFTRSGDVFTITRAQQETIAVDHEADDRFQICIQYIAQRPADIFNDLLTNYTQVESSVIPLPTWQEENDVHLGRVYTTTIAEPTAVRLLINELLEQSASSMWWDDLQNLLRLRVLRGVSADAALYDRSVISKKSFNMTDQLDKRKSQVWTYYGLKNPLEPLDEPKNYRSTLSTIEPDSETDNDGEQAIKEIFSRWIPAGARDNASTLNALILSRYSKAPRMVGFRLMRDSGVFEPEPAGGYKVADYPIQDSTGAPTTMDVQVTSVEFGNKFITVSAEEVLYSQTIAPPDPTTKNVTIDSSENNINIKDRFDVQYSSADPGDTVNIYIEQGVFVGSTMTSMYPMRTGIFPAGVTVNLYNRGRIQGRGGNGGNGGGIVLIESILSYWSAGEGEDGEPGGDALLVETDINIDNTGGEIWSGGGGGGGGMSSVSRVNGLTKPRYGGGGGGGGAGTINSLGGAVTANATPTPANPGNAGTSEIGGIGGAKVGYSTKGGPGGAPGVAGTDGDTAFYSGSEWTGGNGGTGGLPGDAIVQSGGVATIISAGDIKGAIV